MNDYKYYSDLDSHPFTGEYNVNFKARIAQNDHVISVYYTRTAQLLQIAFRKNGKNFIIRNLLTIVCFT